MSMRYTTFSALVVVAVCSVAWPLHAANVIPPPPGDPEAPVSEPTFRTLDMDGDGYVSRLEARRGTNVERQFDKLDTNRDGRLSREELKGMFPIESPGDAAYRRATEPR
jgi:Ca2+-binding EF-hand superfamily protein